nr:hypothetical protein [Tanacetum cinerariifolium]
AIYPNKVVSQPSYDKQWHKTAMAQMRWDIAFGIRMVKRSSEAEMSHLMRTLYMEPDSKHELSSEITQSPCGSSDTSKGSENSGSFEDSGRSDEEDSEDGAFSEEGGSETPHERKHHKACGCSRSKKSIIAVKGKKALDDDDVDLLDVFSLKLR